MSLTLYVYLSHKKTCHLKSDIRKEIKFVFLFQSHDVSEHFFFINFCDWGSYLDMIHRAVHGSGWVGFVPNLKYSGGKIRNSISTQKISLDLPVCVSSILVCIRSVSGFIISAGIWLDSLRSDLDFVR